MTTTVDETFVRASVNASVRHSASAMVHFAWRFGVAGSVEQRDISAVLSEWTW